MARRVAAVKPQGLTKHPMRQHGRAMAQPPAPIDQARQERLAEALRENLRKRKAQARDTPTPVKD